MFTSKIHAAVAAYPVTSHLDIRVVSLRQKFGWAGYGLYQALLELISCQPDKRIPCRYDTLSFLLNENADVIESIITEFKLFEVVSEENSEDYFFSHDLDQAFKAASSNVKKSKSIANQESQRAVSKKDDNTIVAQPTPAMAQSVAVGANSADSDWLDKVAVQTNVDRRVIPHVFAEFELYVKARGNKYRNIEEFRTHFVNWILKGCAKSAINKATYRLQDAEARTRREEERKIKQAEYEQQQRDAMKYEDFCQRNGIETTGSLAKDIMLRMKKEKLRVES